MCCFSTLLTSCREAYHVSDSVTLTAQRMTERNEAWSGCKSARWTLDRAVRVRAQARAIVGLRH